MSMSNGIDPCCREIARFLRNPLKPCILALARPDPKKNITTLIRASCTESARLAFSTLLVSMP